jgi:hypothetical protein
LERADTSLKATRVTVTPGTRVYSSVFCSARNDGDQWLLLDIFFTNYVVGIDLQTDSGTFDDGELEMALFATSTSQTPFLVTNSSSPSIRHDPSSGQDEFYLRIRRLNHKNHDSAFQYDLYSFSWFFCEYHWLTVFFFFFFADDIVW